MISLFKQMDYIKLINIIKIVMFVIIGIIIGRVSMALEYAFLAKKKKAKD